MQGPLALRRLLRSALFTPPPSSSSTPAVKAERSSSDAPGAVLGALGWEEARATALSSKVAALLPCDATLARHALHGGLGEGGGAGGVARAQVARAAAAALLACAGAYRVAHPLSPSARCACFLFLACVDLFGPQRVLSGHESKRRRVRKDVVCASLPCSALVRAAWLGQLQALAELQESVAAVDDLQLLNRLPTGAPAEPVGRALPAPMQALVEVWLQRGGADGGGGGGSGAFAPAALGAAQTAFGAAARLMLLRRAMEDGAGAPRVLLPGER